MPDRHNKNSKQTTYRATIKELQRLDVLSQLERRKKSALITLALEFYIKRNYPKETAQKIIRGEYPMEGEEH